MTVQPAIKAILECLTTPFNLYADPIEVIENSTQILDCFPLGPILVRWRCGYASVCVHFHN